MTNRQVVLAFLRGEYARAGALVSTGNELHSYAYRLASRLTDTSISINYAETGIDLHSDPRGRRYREYDAAFSPTTARHRSLLIDALTAFGYVRVEDTLGLWRYSAVAYDEHAAYRAWLCR